MLRSQISEHFHQKLPFSFWKLNKFKFLEFDSICEFVFGHEFQEYFKNLLPNFLPPKKLEEILNQLWVRKEGLAGVSAPVLNGRETNLVDLKGESVSGENLVAEGEHGLQLTLEEVARMALAKLIEDSVLEDCGNALEDLEGDEASLVRYLGCRNQVLHLARPAGAASLIPTYAKHWANFYRAARFWLSPSDPIKAMRLSLKASISASFLPMPSKLSSSFWYST